MFSAGSLITTIAFASTVNWQRSTRQTNMTTPQRDVLHKVSITFDWQLSLEGQAIISLSWWSANGVRYPRSQHSDRNNLSKTHKQVSTKNCSQQPICYHSVVSNINASVIAKCSPPYTLNCVVITYSYLCLPRTSGIVPSCLWQANLRNSPGGTR